MSSPFRVNVSCDVTLSDEDFRLVALGLCRKLKGDDVAKARDLSNELQNAQREIVAGFAIKPADTDDTEATGR